MAIASNTTSRFLDAKAVKAFLGDAYVKFETAVVSTVVRIKPAVRPLAVALAA
jgi:hypothetical protein